MADWKDYVSPRKREAMGGDPLKPDTFGVDQFGSSTVNGPAPGKGGYLKDHERGARPPIGGNQANPDHGDY